MSVSCAINGPEPRHQEELRQTTTTTSSSSSWLPGHRQHQLKGPSVQWASISQSHMQPLISNQRYSLQPRENTTSMKCKFKQPCWQWHSDRGHTHDAFSLLAILTISNAHACEFVPFQSTCCVWTWISLAFLFRRLLLSWTCCVCTKFVLAWLALAH